MFELYKNINESHTDCIMNKQMCNNCNKYGHLFHQCRLPITSYGVIVFRKNPITNQLVDIAAMVSQFVPKSTGKQRIGREVIFRLVYAIFGHRIKMIEINCDSFDAWTLTDKIIIEHITGLLINFKDVRSFFHQMEI
jgi:hypothetical protein